MSKKTQILTHGLLSGEINGAALQGALENGGFLGAWLSLLQNRDLEELLRSQTALDGIFGSAIAIESVLASNGAAFAASDGATAALAGSSAAMVTIVSDINLLNLWNNVPANKTRLQNLINQSGSCLVRYEITSGPNWTPPDGALVTASVFMTGGGGQGSNGGTNAAAGGGGGGGESRAFQLPSGIPASSQSVTIGSSVASTNTVFQSQTALTGNNGSRPSGGNGAGTTTATIYDTAANTALWQPTAAGRRGGNGGSGASFSGNDGASGADGLTGSGGAGGTSVGFGSSAGAGSGFGSGGGGGSWPSTPNAPGRPGGDAGSTAYGSGGGGGNSGNSGGGGVIGSGGAGRQGIIIVYGVLGAPKP